MSIFEDVKRLLGLEQLQQRAHEPATSSTAPPASDEERYRARLAAEREGKDHFLKSHPQSPLPHDERDSFDGLDYYPPETELRLDLELDRADAGEQLTMQTTTNSEQEFERIGHVSFEVDGEPARLAVYRPVDGGELFVPFRDATSGEETYGAGRYLEPTMLDDETIHVDFNLAYNPFCAYNEEYSCPLPPIENWLAVPIRAGEKAYST